MTEITVTPLADRVASLLRGIEYVRVTTAEELEAVARLRYTCYLREGAIEPRADGVMRDRFDSLPNTMTFAVRSNGRVVASIRIHVLTAELPHSPSALAFEDFIAPLLASGQVVIDPTRFVVDAKAAHEWPELAYVVLRLPFMAGGYFNADIVLAAVRPEHAAFYRKVLRCSMACGPHLYHQLNKPLALMAVNYPEESGAVIRRYPFFTGMRGEAERLFDRSDTIQSSFIPAPDLNGLTCPISSGHA